MNREASYYIKEGGGVTVCALCPRRCALRPGGTGACLARANRDGVLYALNYGKVSSLALDPIEKKPLNRFRPGSYILSAGSFGCNFHCPFCQNHQISRSTPDCHDMTPAELVTKALSAVGGGNIGVAYTYNEPIIWYEFVTDAAKLAKSKGLVNVLVTNGCIETEPLGELLPHIAAMNVDLKGDDDFYSEMCGGDRNAVLHTIETAHTAGCHVEVTNLLVSGRNDNPEAVAAIAGRIAAISEDIPLHLSRFFPRYKMLAAAPTPAAFVYEAAAIARQYLKYVYTGNV